MSGLPSVRPVVMARPARVVVLALTVLGSLVQAIAVPAPAQAFVAPSTHAASRETSAPSLAASRSAAPATAKVSSAVKLVRPKGAIVPAKAPTGLSSSSIIATARKYDGAYYRAGGTTPAGFDCSGYTRYVFGKLGKALPHNAAAQYTVVHHISRSSIRVGDLIFFRSGSGHIYHVGIYAGSGHLYHASEPGVRTGLGTVYSSNVVFGRI